MTFKHKLSCRLALLRNVVLLGAVCAAAACDLRQLLGLLAPVASVAVAPATATVPMGQTVQFAATPRDSIGNALTARVVTWVSNAAAVATVDINGMVTGVAAGTSTITATSEARSGTAVVTVTSSAPPPPPPPPPPPRPPPPPPPPPPAPPDPAQVTDLAVASVTDSSGTLSIHQVDDGTGQPASYIVKYAVGTLAWSTGLAVTRGTCVTPVAGTAIGATLSCTVLGLTPATAYQFGIVAFRGDVNTNAVFGPLSNLASGTTNAGSTMPVAVVTVSPASANVTVGAVQQFAATLKDASGRTLTGRTVTWSSDALAMATVSGTGLVTGIALGSATITATSEGQSGPAALSVSVAPPGGVLFESDWSTALGNDPVSALRDGGRWSWEADWGGGKIMSVVPGGSGGHNALRVVQRGELFAAFIGKDNLVPPSTDYYVRYYMRNDDTSPSGDHVVVPDYQAYANLTYMRKYSSSTGWRFVISMYGCTFIYPISQIGPAVELAHGVWYRIEYYVHFVNPTQIQVHVRVYDEAGVQILGDADFRQEDYGTQVWNGRSDWTLASLYASGFSYCVNPVALTMFAVGNNGNGGAVDTGLPWYYANLQIRSDRWPGP